MVEWLKCRRKSKIAEDQAWSFGGTADATSQLGGFLDFGVRSPWSLEPNDGGFVVVEDRLRWEEVWLAESNGEKEAAASFQNLGV